MLRKGGPCYLFLVSNNTKKKIKATLVWGKEVLLLGLGLGRKQGKKMNKGRSISSSKPYSTLYLWSSPPFMFEKCQLDLFTRTKSVQKEPNLWGTHPHPLGTTGKRGASLCGIGRGGDPSVLSTKEGGQQRNFLK